MTGVQTCALRSVKLASEYEGRPGAVLARLQDLYPKLIDLSLDRLEVLLAKLGHPERALPPVIHVAGTNGKGSTCANLRAIAEEAGLRVHVMTSPHLVSIRERFRLAGKLVDENLLVEAFEEVARANDSAPITVFEVLTAAGLLLFSRIPADLVILEVGLGGRLDATMSSPTRLSASSRPSVSTIRRFSVIRSQPLRGKKRASSNRACLWSALHKSPRPSPQSVQKLPPSLARKRVA